MDRRLKSEYIKENNEKNYFDFEFIAPVFK